jgi:hypothetical protein
VTPGEVVIVQTREGEFCYVGIYAGFEQTTSTSRRPMVLVEHDISGAESPMALTVECVVPYDEKLIPDLYKEWNK